MTAEALDGSRDRGCAICPPRTWENIRGRQFPDAVNGTGRAIVGRPFDPRTVWLGTGGENDEICDPMMRRGVERVTRAPAASATHD